MSGCEMLILASETYRNLVWGIRSKQDCSVLKNTLVALRARILETVFDDPDEHESHLVAGAIVNCGLILLGRKHGPRPC